MSIFYNNDLEYDIEHDDFNQDDLEQDDLDETDIQYEELMSITGGVGFFENIHSDEYGTPEDEEREDDKDADGENIYKDNEMSEFITIQNVEEALEASPFIEQSIIEDMGDVDVGDASPFIEQSIIEDMGGDADDGDVGDDADGGDVSPFIHQSIIEDMGDDADAGDVSPFIEQIEVSGGAETDKINFKNDDILTDEELIKGIRKIIGGMVREFSD